MSEIYLFKIKYCNVYKYVIIFINILLFKCKLGKQNEIYYYKV